MRKSKGCCYTKEDCLVAIGLIGDPQLFFGMLALVGLLFRISDHPGKTWINEKSLRHKWI